MDRFEKIFGKSAQIVVVTYLIQHRDKITYLSGIAEATGLSHSSVARVIEPLIEENIVIEDGIGKQMRTFSLNRDNKRTKVLMRFFDDLNDVLIE
jgi:DNA-binding transcriptional regulator GbsR (MarR family)